MTFFRALDAAMKQDFGGRGLLTAFPDNPLKETLESLKTAGRVILLTGFPVRAEDGTVIGETDGPLGTADLAAALTALGIPTLAVTDPLSFAPLNASLFYRAPQAKLLTLPRADTAAFISDCVKNFAPTHVISLELPGKAADGHFHNMRGEIMDDVVTDSSAFLPAAHAAGAAVISVGDGGNEFCMGAYRDIIERFVPHGETICAEAAADLALAAGVSNWWGLGLAALLSLIAGRSLLPTDAEETESLRRIVAAGSVDGCTKRREMTVDNLPLSVHLEILRQVRELTVRELQPAAFR